MYKAQRLTRHTMAKNEKGRIRTHCCRITSILGFISIASILPFQMIAKVNNSSPLEAQIISSMIPLTMSIRNLSSEAERRMSSRRKHPRILQYDAESNSVTMPILERIPNLKPAKVPKQAIPSSSEDDNYEPMCHPIHEWQTRTFPVCNNVHEVNMRPESGSVVLINCKFQLCKKLFPVHLSLTDTNLFPYILFTGGGSRCAFKIRDNGDNWIVLKISKYVGYLLT